MRLRTVFVFLLLITALLTSCGKSERIEGKVYDIFGNPLKDVTVKIQKSTFSSKTDGSGSYSLDYAPGSMKLFFSKDGYTTSNLDLNIQQKTHFPAEVITLYPIPKENGIFYIDTENKHLVKLEENSKVQEIKMRNQGFSLTMNYSYYVSYSKPAITIKPGKAVFINRIPYPITLHTVMKNGLIYEGNLNMFERQDKYSGSLNTLAAEVGEEKLLLGTVELSPGSYVWVKMFRGEMIGYVPEKNGVAFGFQVEGTGGK